MILQILQVAQQQMGMMESVLVRVEGLMTLQKTSYNIITLLH